MPKVKKSVIKLPNETALVKNYQLILENLVPDAGREGLIKTPDRVARAMSFFTQGYGMDASKIIKGALFTENVSEMVLIKDIEVYSLCEHHLLPFFGKVHIAYIPNGKIVGLSKVARVVDVFSRRLQVQERLTNEILNAMQDALDAQGVAVVMECKHLCMIMRGVQKQNSSTTTSAFTGVFKNALTRSEFLKLIGTSLH